MTKEERTKQLLAKVKADLIRLGVDPLEIEADEILIKEQNLTPLEKTNKSN